MLIVLLLLLSWALLAPAVVRHTGRAAGWVLAAGPALAFAWWAVHAPGVAAGDVMREALPWVPSLGVGATFALDGLSLLFALLICGLGAVITVYAGGYLSGHPDAGRFFLTFFAFMAAMLGLVLADNLLVLFVFWEATSVCSYLLVGFKHESAEARRSALQALLVTAGGGLALLLGILLLGHAGGSLELSVLVDRAAQVQAHPLYLAAFGLVATGAFTKSAQVPFHFWLPNAMAAPTPVSAYLHSATMVKAGVYLLARLDPVLGGTAAWVWTLALVGGATMLVGSVGALQHTDMKKVLAYSTITALGTLVVLLGLSYGPSIKAAVVFLVVHALYKSGLFLVAGSVDRATGTRNAGALGGLYRAMPLTALAAVLAGLSMAGLPPLFGFVGKELAYKAKLGVENLGWLLPAIAVVANALTVVAAGLLVAGPFFGRPRPLGRPRKQAPAAPPAAHGGAHPRTHGGTREVGPSLWAGPLVVGTAGVVLGAAPGLLYGLVSAAVAAVAGEPVSINLALWYGVNQALYLSIATVALGGIGYAALPGLRRLLARLRPLAGAGPEKAYERGLAGLLDGARRASDVLAGASLRHTQAVAFSVLVAAVGTTLWLKGGPAGGPAVTGVDLSISFHEGLLAGVVGAAAVVAAAARAPLVSLTSLGVVGIGLALLFVVIGAPDLAMTQVLVEILAVVIALGVLQGVVAPRPAEPPRHRAGAALLGLGVGATVALLVLAVLAVPPSTAVADYFVRESVPGGFGRNVVNVILVDFRALDTLGEITVLAVAALGAFALLASARPRGTGPGPRGARSVVLQAGARLLLALLLLASLFMLWRGHNEPGGGFIGGLFASAAVVLYLLAFRQGATERLMRAAPQSALTAGLAVAVASGLLAAARAGLPFLTGQWVEVGELKLGTPLLFDLGVFLVVVGFTLTIVLSIERVAVPPAFAGAPSPLPPRANGDAPASKAGATRRAVRAPSRS